MKKLLARIWAFFRFSKKPEQKQTNPLTLERQGTRETSKKHGAYLSFGALLEDLEEKFDRLARIKYPKTLCSIDHQLLKNLGAFIPGPDIEVMDGQLESHIAKQMPAVLLSSIPMSTEDDNILGDFLLLIKHKARDGTVQMVPPHHDTFVINLLTTGSHGIPPFFVTLGHIAVKPDGSVYELRYLANGNHGRRCWRYSPKLSTFRTLTDTFIILANLSASRDYHWQVVARRDGKRITCAIPDNDAPRFFAKREDKTKKIFHAVAAHKRLLKSGAETNVKTHYRGSRRFNHNGIDIEIRMPGKHYSPVSLQKRAVA